MVDKRKGKVIIYLIAVSIVAGICIYNYQCICHYKGCDQEKIYGSEYCYNHTCNENGCYELKESSERWCATHKAKHEEENRKWLAEYNSRPDCAVKGCEFKAEIKGGYCVMHECTALNCRNRCVDGGMYCVNHTCKEPGCFNRVALQDSVCEECQNKANRKRNAEITRQNELTRKSGEDRSTKKYSMPDCDDYDSYEEFMDEWEGFMPDGSDAEDYWENW